MENTEFTDKISEYIQNTIKNYLSSHADKKDNSSDFIVFQQDGDMISTTTTTTVDGEESQAKRYSDFLFIFGGFLSCLLLWIGRFTYRKLKRYCDYNKVDTMDSQIVIGPYSNSMTAAAEKEPTHPPFNTLYHDVAQQIKGRLLEKADVINKKFNSFNSIDGEAGKELFQMNNNTEQPLLHSSQKKIVAAEAAAPVAYVTIEKDEKQQQQQLSTNL